MSACVATFAWPVKRSSRWTLPAVSEVVIHQLQLWEDWESTYALRATVDSLRGNYERKLVSRVGIEPTTRRLRVCCSAN